MIRTLAEGPLERFTKTRNSARRCSRGNQAKESMGAGSYGTPISQGRSHGTLAAGRHHLVQCLPLGCAVQIQLLDLACRLVLPGFP